MTPRDAPEGSLLSMLLWSEFGSNNKQKRVIQIAHNLENSNLILGARDS